MHVGHESMPTYTPLLVWYENVVVSPGSAGDAQVACKPISLLGSFTDWFGAGWLGASDFQSRLSVRGHHAPD